MNFKKEQERQEILTHINRYKMGDLSQMEYCRKHDITYSSLTYWLRKSKKLTTEDFPHGYVNFDPKPIEPAYLTSDPVFEVVLGDGKRLIFYDRSDLEYVKTLIMGNGFNKNLNK